ncbi:MAG: uroporphyrinogen decarboxylase family protein [Syntrophomonadaceae bacterium]
MGRIRVWNTLRKINQDRPPKGELVIEDAFLRQAGVSREALLEELQADLITLPVNYQSKIDWRYWRRQDYFTFALIEGPFSTMITALGWQRASAWIVHDPDLSRKFMAGYLQNLCDWADHALDDGCEGLILADDLADQRGLLLAPEYLQTYYFPELQAWLHKYQIVKTPVMFHSDGNITDIMADLKQVGFWGVQGLQPDAGMNKKDFMSGLLQKWAFWGNFQFEGPLGLKAARQVQNEAARLCEEWQPTSAYIFGSCSGLYAGLPLNLVRAAYRAVK